MIRIRTKVGNGRVFTCLDKDKWVTFATGLQFKEATSLLEAGQNHLMAGRALYLKMLEDERRLNQVDLGPRPGETWDKYGK